MALEDQIRSALAERDRRSSAAPTPTLAEIEAAASADVRLVPDVDGAMGAGSAGRGPRRVQVAVAAAVALVVVIAGVVVLGDRGDEDAVVAGPVAEGGVTWRDAPLLAPSDVDWYVTQWDPNLPPPDVVPARWPVSGLVFVSHDVAWGLGVSYVAGDAGPAMNASGEQTIAAEEVDLAGRRVTVYELSSDAPLGSGLPSSVSTTVAWREGSFEVSLGGSIGTATGVVDDTPVTNEVPPEPARITPEVIEAVVASIQPVPFEMWSDALQPADGVPAPDVSADSGAGVSSSPFFAGDTVRPLRIGAPEELASSKLWVAPWTRSWTTLRQTSTQEPLALEVTTRQHSSTGGNLVGADGTSVPIDVRGTRGAQATRGDDAFVTPLYGGDEPRTADKSITWDESGSEVSLLYPAEVSDDEALALANSLVIVDDTRWEALLFPGDRADHSSTAAATVPDDDGDDVVIESALPLLVPDGLAWSQMSVSNGIDGPRYTISFSPTGESSLAVNVEVAASPIEPSITTSADETAIDETTIAVGGRTITVRGVPATAEAALRWDDGTYVRVDVWVPSAEDASFEVLVDILHDGIDRLVEVDPDDWWPQHDDELRAVAPLLSVPSGDAVRVVAIEAVRATQVTQYLAGGASDEVRWALTTNRFGDVVPPEWLATAERVTIRGNPGYLVRATGALVWDLNGRQRVPDFMHALVWNEGGVSIVLAFPASADEGAAAQVAATFADELEAVDLPRWREITGL